MVCWSFNICWIVLNLEHLLCEVESTYKGGKVSLSLPGNPRAVSIAMGYFISLFEAVGCLGLHKSILIQAERRQ